MRRPLASVLVAGAALLATTIPAAAQGAGTQVQHIDIPLTHLAPITNSCAPQDGPIQLNDGVQQLTLRTMPDGTTLADLRIRLTGTSATGVPYLDMVHETTPQPITLNNFKRTEMLISQGPSANQRIDNVGHGNVVSCFGDDTLTPP